MYAACIVANYQAVEKGMCQELFMEFKNCVQQKVSQDKQGGFMLGRQRLQELDERSVDFQNDSSLRFKSSSKPSEDGDCLDSVQKWNF